LPAFALWPQPEGIQLLLQIQVRDSDGNLVTYIEGKPKIFDLDRFVQWLESKSQKNIMVKNDKKYEVRHISFESTFSQMNTMGGYFVKLPINGRIDNAIHMDHGSYHTRPGDTLTANLTFIRQI
jgi:hypothetical protein